MKKFLIIIMMFLIFVPLVRADILRATGDEPESDEVLKEGSEELPNNLLAQNAKSSILIEASTGEVLYEYNSHEKLAPASMTKMMSLVLIMEAIDAGVINYEDQITATSNASGMGGSQILLEEGERMSVDDLLKGITIASGNDMTVA
jgi:D-alanyl-D-alanine carboxypeptidase (penicillin-binding protein 5/6)